MSLKEQIYSVMIVSAAENINSALQALLPETKYFPVMYEESIAAAKRQLADRAFDFVIINSPLPDDIGSRFAVEICNHGSTVVLLLARAEVHDELFYKVAEHGVFTMPKPTSRQNILMALSWMASARERLRRSEKKTISIEEKMEEIRIVNRAKWMLIKEIRMEEADAHRYIEKQAMDRCVSRRQIAEEIIRTYS